MGDLTSATKSHIVKSISCPTPDIVGIGKAEISRARSSLLKHHKSSIEPPPLASITVSTWFPLLFSLKTRILSKASIIVLGAVSP